MDKSKKIDRNPTEECEWVATFRAQTGDVMHYWEPWSWSKHIGTRHKAKRKRKDGSVVEVEIFRPNMVACKLLARVIFAYGTSPTSVDSAGRPRGRRRHFKGPYWQIDPKRIARDFSCNVDTIYSALDVLVDLKLVKKMPVPASELPAVYANIKSKPFYVVPKPVQIRLITHDIALEDIDAQPEVFGLDGGSQPEVFGLAQPEEFGLAQPEVFRSSEGIQAKQAIPAGQTQSVTSSGSDEHNAGSSAVEQRKQQARTAEAFVLGKDGGKNGLSKSVPDTTVTAYLNSLANGRKSAQVKRDEGKVKAWISDLVTGLGCTPINSELTRVIEFFTAEMLSGFQLADIGDALSQDIKGFAQWWNDNGNEGMPRYAVAKLVDFWKASKSLVLIAAEADVEKQTIQERFGIGAYRDRTTGQIMNSVAKTRGPEDFNDHEKRFAALPQERRAELRDAQRVWITEQTRALEMLMSKSDVCKAIPDDMRYRTAALAVNSRYKYLGLETVSVSIANGFAHFFEAETGQLVKVPQAEGLDWDLAKVVETYSTK